MYAIRSYYGFGCDAGFLYRLCELLELRDGNRFTKAVGELDRRRTAVNVGKGQQDTRQQSYNFV